MRRRIAGEAAVLLLALQFLTRLPVPVAFSPARMAAIPRWLPVAGALIGAFAAAVFWLAAAVFPPVLAALISTAATVLLTGALHEDGLADLCDGLGGVTRARALEIMRDSRIGTYGAVGVGLTLAAKILALGSMPAASVPLVLIAGHAASRAAPTLVIATMVYVRAEGAGASVAAGVGRAGLVFAVGAAGLAVAATGSVLPGAAVLGGAAGALLGYAAARRAFARRLGGYTGDCLGAVQQASEVGFYLGALACL